MGWGLNFNPIQDSATKTESVNKAHSHCNFNWAHIKLHELIPKSLEDPAFSFKGQNNKKESYFFGILFLINTVDSSIIIAKSGRIIQVGDSGTAGVGEGVVFVEELVVEAGVGDGVEVGADVRMLAQKSEQQLDAGVGVGFGANVAEMVVAPSMFWTV